MASIRKSPLSSFWIACFTLPDGRRTQRSTKVPIQGETASQTKANKRKAIARANEFERVSRSHITARQAQRVVADIYREVFQESLPSSTVGDYCDGWLEKKKPEISPISYLFYERKIADFKEWLGIRTAVELRAIEGKDILAFRNHCAERHNPTTVNHTIKVVRMMFESALREQLIMDNPAAGIDSLKRTSRPVRRAWTEAELKAVLAVADDEWKSLILFGLYTGQRLGDLARLTWENIDLSRGELRLITGKTGRSQIVPLAKPLQQHLESLTSTDNPKQPIHPRAYNIAMRESDTGTLSRQFGELMADAGLRPKKSHAKAEDQETEENKSKPSRRGRRQLSEISFHALRHTATSMLKNAGVSPAIVQEIIGHDSEAVNRIYTHIETDAMRKALDKMPTIKIPSKA